MSLSVDCVSGSGPRFFSPFILAGMNRNDMEMIIFKSSYISLKNLIKNQIDLILTWDFTKLAFLHPENRGFICVLPGFKREIMPSSFRIVLIIIINPC